MNHQAVCLSFWEWGDRNQLGTYTDLEGYIGLYWDNHWDMIGM